MPLYVTGSGEAVGCRRWAVRISQAIGVLATIIYCAVVTTAIVYVLKAVTGLRVASHEEESGVDTTVHGEAGYSF